MVSDFERKTRRGGPAPVDLTLHLSHRLAQLLGLLQYRQEQCYHWCDQFYIQWRSGLW